MVQVGYDYNYYQQGDAEQPIREERQSRTVKRITKKKVNNKKKLLVKTGGALFIYALFLVFLCVKAATMDYSIVQLENEIDELQTSNDRIEYQIAQMTSLERVETIARNELNMYKPYSSMNVAAGIPAQPQDSINMASAIEENNNVDAAGNSLEKLYASLMQLADNH